MSRCVGIVAIALFVSVFGCAPAQDDLVGTWTSKTPGEGSETWRMELDQDGFATLVVNNVSVEVAPYGRWELDGSRLVLTHDARKIKVFFSVGNGYKESDADVQPGEHDVFDIRVNKDGTLSTSHPEHPDMVWQRS